VDAEAHLRPAATAPGRARQHPQHVPQAARCPVCGRPLPADRRDQRYCSAACYRRAPPVVTADPSPAQIARRTARIRAGWSEAERCRRLRPDWRRLPWRVPVVDEGLLAAAPAGTGTGPWPRPPSCQVPVPAGRPGRACGVPGVPQRLPGGRAGKG
jgi:hypothetical protein